eukprot:5351765-Prymnesium_polylepis.2
MVRSVLPDQFTTRVCPCAGWVHTPGAAICRVGPCAGWVHMPGGSMTMCCTIGCFRTVRGVQRGVAASRTTP